jgi:hypothetical protein
VKDVAHNAVMAAYGDHQAGGILDTPYRTEDYIIGIGYPDTKAEEEARLMYLVVNRGTGVVEYAGTCLPDTIQIMGRMQEALQKYRIEPELPGIQ